MKIGRFFSRIASNNILFYGLIVLIFMGLIDYVIRGYDVIRYEYGINVLIFTYIFIICELFFNAGIYMMLKGSGFFKIKIRDLFKFKLKDLNINNKITLFGFLINRLAATIPWVYLLIVGVRHLPWPVIIVILLELSIVLHLGAKVKFAITNHKQFNE